MSVKPHHWTWLCILPLILIVQSVNSAGTFASSIWRPGRFDGGIIATSVENYGLITCLNTCKQYGSCKGFNYQVTTHTCEILSSALCDNDTSVLSTVDNTWRYYDLLDYDAQEYEMSYRDKPSCTKAGKCSEKCSRTINATCSHDEQCVQKAENSFCSLTTNSSGTGICTCSTHYWAYNDTRCIHQISYSGFIWSWLNKKIVNSMCNVTFTLKAPVDFQIRLMNGEDFYNGVPNYEIRIGYASNTTTRLARTGVLITEVSTPGILTNDFQNFTLSWCNGAINVGRQREAPVLSWTDSVPITPIRGMGFYSVASNNHIFLPHNLVDPYFPTSESSGVLRVNGYDYHKVKLLDSGAPTSDVSFIFECMAPRDCNVIFGQLSNDYNFYKFIFGSFVNTLTSLWSSRHNGWILPHINTPSIVSNAEYRKFWITINGRTFKAGKADDPIPLINWTETVDVNLTHVSICTFDGDIGYYKVLSHRQFHEYPNGGYV